MEYEHKCFMRSHQNTMKIPSCQRLTLILLLISCYISILSKRNASAFQVSTDSSVSMGRNRRSMSITTRMDVRSSSRRRDSNSEYSFYDDYGVEGEEINDAGNFNNKKSSQSYSFSKRDNASRRDNKRVKNRRNSPRRSGGDNKGGGFKKRSTGSDMIGSSLNNGSIFDHNDLEMNLRLDNERKREAINCEHFGKCPGCVVNDHVANVDIIESSKLYFASRNSGSRKSNNYDNYNSEFYNVVIPSPITKWRTQAKLAVSPKSAWGRDGCNFGLYERGSHTVMPIPNCAVHHPSINHAVEILTAATASVSTSAYTSETGEGGLRYVQMRVERSTGKVCLTLVWNASGLKDAQPELSRLVKELKRLEPKFWHGIWCHTNDTRGNAIFARGAGRWHHMDGPEFVRERIPGTDLDKREGLLYFNPMAFRQGNMDGFEAIALQVARAIPPGSKVCELYAGIGLLGLTALTYHAKLAAESEHGDSNNDTSSGMAEDNSWWEEDDPIHYPSKQTRPNKKSNPTHLPIKWVNCSDENPANTRCFQRSVSSMPTFVTDYQDTKKNNKGNKNKKNRKGSQETNSSSVERTLDNIMQEIMSGGPENGATSSFTDKKRPKGKAMYSVASAVKALHEGQALGAQVLVVDPPRKGLDEGVLEQLCKPHNPKQEYTEDPLFLDGKRHNINWVNSVHTLIYVSCGFDALTHDCDELLSGNAGWRLESSTGYVLFPGSNHVETVAIFKRNAGQNTYI